MRMQTFQTHGPKLVFFHTYVLAIKSVVALLFFPFNKNLLYCRTVTSYESRMTYCYNIELFTFERVNMNIFDDFRDDSHQKLLLKKN